MNFVSHPWPHLLFASLHLFVGHFLSAFIHLRRFGRNPLVLYRANATPHARITRVVAALSSAFALSLILTAFMPSLRATFLGAARIDVPSWLAWCVASLGLLLMAFSQFSMGAQFRVGQHEGDAPKGLQTQGIHAYSRNPIYVGSWLFLLGMTLWYPSLLLLALLLAIGASMHGLVRAEEAFLQARFGTLYETYCARTPRYLGLRRPSS